MRYFIMIAMLAFLALEIFVFVKIITKYRKRYVPAATMLAIFALNFALIILLQYSPIGRAVPQPAPIAAPSPPSP
jgi:hypothetical protein